MQIRPIGMNFKLAIDFVQHQQCPALQAQSALDLKSQLEWRPARVPETTMRSGRCKAPFQFQMTKKIVCALCAERPLKFVVVVVVETNHCCDSLIRLYFLALILFQTLIPIQFPC